MGIANSLTIGEENSPPFLPILSTIMHELAKKIFVVCLLSLSPFFFLFVPLFFFDWAIENVCVCVVIESSSSCCCLELERTFGQHHSYGERKSFASFFCLLARLLLLIMDGQQKGRMEKNQEEGVHGKMNSSSSSISSRSWVVFETIAVDFLEINIFGSVCL